MYGGYGYGPVAGAGYGCGYGPVAGAGYAPMHGHDCGKGFALIVVLFILLIIVGASWFK
ncbi:YjcZ family sporulation protein [Halalkalibacterium ligniniphilum]|uniref:YjcZ family sporulation protein n=1 Tax=Halalkalibacterium ligniniphilum TaxID=1134413 RepID=UPI000344FD58|nr:YjcZ family sporulation protein [Halalkalibacterium ligniniphilum]